MVDHRAHIFLASRPLFSVYSYAQWYLCTFLRCYGIPAFQTALHGLRYELYCTNIFHIIGMFFFFFFFLLLCFIYRTFSSFIMAPTKKPASTKAKAKAPSAKATASPCVHLQPNKAPNKESMSVKHTSSSKPSIAATMDTSISSDSSVSSTNVGDYAVLPDVSDFVPSSLPSGRGTIPIDVKHSFQSTLNIMSKINFSSLSKDKSIEWNVALSQSCHHLSEEYSLL
jgi:Na+-transporting methylmalonyl-CoA/oxaloacetate decarboxylase gamma subunit